MLSTNKDDLLNKRKLLKEMNNKRMRVLNTLLVNYEDCLDAISMTTISQHPRF